MKILLVLITFASFYHSKFEGRKTTNGDIFSNNNLTAAYNHVPLGTYLKVINIENNKSVIVQVNDKCGINNRIDLSQKAFKELAPLTKGLIKVKIIKK